ncbi:hypothetical protein Q8G71_36250, partial [Klebsiella pneumoniae]
GVDKDSEREGCRAEIGWRKGGFGHLFLLLSHVLDVGRPGGVAAAGTSRGKKAGRLGGAGCSERERERAKREMLG